MNTLKDGLTERVAIHESFADFALRIRTARSGMPGGAGGRSPGPLESPVRAEKSWFGSKALKQKRPIWF